jgi:hypothetical protein
MALVGVLAAACTSLTPVQKDRLSELQIASDRVTKYYRVPTMQLRAGWPVNPFPLGSPTETEMVLPPLVDSPDQPFGVFIAEIVLTPEVLDVQSGSDFAFAVGLAPFVNQ